MSVHLGAHVRPGGGSERPYDQAVFRQFLAIERRRAEHSSRSFVLVLVSLRSELGVRRGMPRRLAAAVFAALAASVREVDFVGWYREGRVAGAVLAQAGDPPAQVVSLITSRISAAMSKHVPIDARPQLKVRIAPLYKKPLDVLNGPES